MRFRFSPPLDQTPTRMAPIKRASDQATKKPRRNKKARKGGQEETPEPVILGSTSTKSLVPDKNDEELELEEAVFGRRTDGGAADQLWDLAEEDLGKGKGKMKQDFDSDEDDDEQDLEETGLERLRDDNVSFLRRVECRRCRETG